MFDGFRTVVVALLTLNLGAQASPVRTLSALKALPTPKDDAPTSDLSSDAQRLLHQVRQELATWALQRLNAPDLREASPTEQTQWMKTELGHSPAGNEPELGDVTDLRIEDLRGHSGFRAMTITLGLPCGEDSGLLLFHRDGAAWSLVLKEEANLGEDIREAHWGEAWDTSASSADGHFFLASAYITPWCQSAWRQVTLDIFSIAPEGSVRKIHHMRQSIYIGLDDPLFTLAFKGQDEVFFSFQGHDPDPDILIRAIHLHYRLGTDRAVLLKAN